MIIERIEVDRFEALIRDIRSGILPRDLAPSALLAFLVENPHLLMIEKFDEHMQVQVSEWQAEILSLITEHSNFGDFVSFGLPHLEFRTQTGRWAGLVCSPPFFDSDRSPDFQFSLNSRQVLKKSPEWQQLWYEEWAPQLEKILDSEIVTLTTDELIAELRHRVHQPRESSSVLWAPKLWTPSEQARQRALLDTTLSPHFERWKAKGVCLDDLNPSEFEDLVGEVLLAAGLKIHKVREVPQGGRDLIARGVLIPEEEPIEMAVEVKHRRVVDRPQVQFALYQNRAYPALLFVTSGRFTAGVFKEKAREENHFRLFLKDGLAIGDLVRTHFSLDAEVGGQSENRARPPREGTRQPGR